MGASPKPRELLQQAATDDEQATLLQRNDGDSAAAAAPAGDSSIYSPAGPAPAAVEAKATAGNSGTRRRRCRSSSRSAEDQLVAGQTPGRQLYASPAPSWLCERNMAAASRAHLSIIGDR